MAHRSRGPGTFVQIVFKSAVSGSRRPRGPDRGRQAAEQPEEHAGRLSLVAGLDRDHLASDAAQALAGVGYVDRQAREHGREEVAE
jgi:hypothetical protein